MEFTAGPSALLSAAMLADAAVNSAHASDLPWQKDVRTVILAIGVALSFVSSIGSYFYAGWLSKRNRQNDLALSEFTERFRTPIAAQLRALEEIVEKVSAALMNSDEEKALGELAKIQKEEASPTFIRLSDALQRADESKHVSGSGWANFAELRWDEVLTAFDMMNNAAADAPRRALGHQQLISEIRNLCRQLRTWLYEEAQRINSGRRKRKNLVD